MFRRHSILPLYVLLGLGLSASVAWPTLLTAQSIAPLTLRADDAASRALPGLVKGSHVKVFIPSLPYLYTSHAINGALIKPSNNQRGWDYDMAVKHEQINDTTYEFQLRHGVRFQDGSPFNADSVIMNMEYFKKAPVQYSKIDAVFDRVEKIDDYTVRFHLKEKYGCFLNDAIWMQFYTEEYLTTNTNGWNGKATCPNLSRPGPFGLGPYILTEGYIEGDRHSPQAVLKANPYYWDKQYPKVETITVYTELTSAQATEQVLYEEGRLDISVIRPEDKVEAVLAPYSKLVVSPSTDNVAIHMNLINGNPKLRDREVRRALNSALHQRNLLHFVYEEEGDPSPISPHFPGVREVVADHDPFPYWQDPYQSDVQAKLREVLNKLSLKVLTQDRFLPLWRCIEYQFAKVGVELTIETTKSEKEIFESLLATKSSKGQSNWDLLIWGNDDWFFNHPFTAFFVFRTHSVWNTTPPDPMMDGYIDEMFRLPVDAPGFPAACRSIMERAYDQAYMLFVPTPYKVFAVNKEVVFEPYKMACMPLWKIQVTDRHWSVRPPEEAYPESMKTPLHTTRINGE
jgi:ABC-type transport system substrate-binding protein